MEGFHCNHQMVQAMLAGDSRAFDAFFRSYFSRVYGFALRRLNYDAQAAHDVVQTTLIKAIQKLEQYRGRASLFTWIFQICRNESANFIRRHRRDDARVVSIDSSPRLRVRIESIEAPDDYDTDGNSAKAEIAQGVQTVLGSLPVTYEKVLQWKYLEGVSVKKIGGRLGMSAVATQSLLARARSLFRRTSAAKKAHGLLRQ